MRRLPWRPPPVEDVAGVLCLVGVLVAMALGVFYRYVLNDSLVWPEEVSRYGLIYMTYLGCATGIRRGSHIRIDLVDLVLPPAARRVVAVAVDAVVLLFCAFMAVKTAQIMAVLSTSRSTAMQIPIAWVYLALLLGFALSGLRLILRYVRPAAAGNP